MTIEAPTSEPLADAFVTFFKAIPGGRPIGRAIARLGAEVLEAGVVTVEIALKAAIALDTKQQLNNPGLAVFPDSGARFSVAVATLPEGYSDYVLARADKATHQTNRVTESWLSDIQRTYYSVIEKLVS